MEGEVLRDDQWERLREFVPGGCKGKHGPRSDGRRFFDAILWIARSGGRWRDPPERFGPYRTAKRRYYRWIEQGVFGRIFAAVSDEPDMEMAGDRGDGHPGPSPGGGSAAKKGAGKPRLSAGRAAGSEPKSTPLRLAACISRSG